MNEPLVVDRNVTTQLQAPSDYSTTQHNRIAMHDLQAHDKTISYTHPHDASPNSRTMISNLTPKTTLLKALYAAQFRNNVLPENATIHQETIDIEDESIPPRLLPDEEPFDTPTEMPTPNYEQRTLLEQIDRKLEQLQQQQSATETDQTRHISTITPIHMITFNANSLAINATQEVRDNIKKPNTAMTITDTRMTEEKLKRYKKRRQKCQQNLNSTAD